jgi:hypothetical protein
MTTSQVPVKVPALPPLLPPPSDKGSHYTASSKPETIDTATENDEAEEWGWGEFVHHTEDFAEFPRLSPSSAGVPTTLLHSHDHTRESGGVDESTEGDSVVMRCLHDLIAVVGAIDQEEEVSAQAEAAEGRSVSSERSHDNFVLVSETEEDPSLARGSSTESDRSSTVVVSNEPEPLSRSPSPSCDFKGPQEESLERSGEEDLALPVPLPLPDKDSSDECPPEETFVFPSPEEMEPEEQPDEKEAEGNKEKMGESVEEQSTVDEGQVESQTTLSDDLAYEQLTGEREEAASRPITVPIDSSPP